MSPGGMTEASSTLSPESLSGRKLQVPQRYLDWLPSLPASLLPPSCPGINSHINYLHLDPGLWMCFCGNPDQGRNTEIAEFTDGPNRVG